MAFILLDNKPFEETHFINELELEKVVCEKKNFILGESTILLDYKRKVSSKKSKNAGIPDGYLFDLSNTRNPRLFFIENELESHNLYDHIGPQIMRFYAAFETSKRELHKKLALIIKQDSPLKNEIIEKINNTPFDNIDALLNHIIYDNNVGIILIIDEQTDDLNSLLMRLQDKPEVVVVKKYQYGDSIIYQYTPFREGTSQTTITEKNTGRKLIPLKEIDTIVCPAREDGFKHAFIENDSWWAVRISPSLIPQLKYIAMYETNPVSEIKWIAKIRENGIQPYKNTGKYIISVEEKKKINPIKLDKEIKGMAPQSPRYTIYEKLTNAKKMSELWYE